MLKKSEIAKLADRLKKHSIKNSVSVNSYPSNYVEEGLPQIITEIRYRKDHDPNNEFRKEEALALATKLETFIDEILSIKYRNWFFGTSKTE